LAALPGKLEVNARDLAVETVVLRVKAFMQLRVKAVALSKNGRRWVEFVVEVQHHRGWSVLRTFRDLEEYRRFLAEQPEDHAIEFVTM
jgi:hypothetical protein